MRENSTENPQRWNIQRMFQYAAIGCMIFLCSRAAADLIQPQLPADVTMNKGVGHGNLLFVTLQLGDGEELPFVVDTGSARTLLDISFEPQLGKRLGTGRASHFADNYQSGIYTAPRLRLGNTPLVTASNIWTYDFKNQLTSRAGKQIRGILGMDCLEHYCIQLDFEAGKVHFLDPRHLDVEKLGKAFPITITNPGNRPFIHRAGLNGGTSTNCLIDTGCSYDGRVEQGTINGHESGNGHLSGCTWDGEIYTNLNIQAGEHANMIGLRFLARHLVTLDFPNRTLYLKQTSVGPLK
jgi:hypothetical protein